MENPVVFLKAKRVYLRPIEKTDVPLLTRWINDPDVRQYLKAFLPNQNSEEEKWVDELATRKTTDVVLMICLTEDDRPIGTMGIHRISWKDRTATTGALIGEKELWGKGYGSEAKMVLLDYAFNTLNLRKICSTANATNPRSIAYSQKCGYKVEGVLRKHVFIKGRYVDQVHLAIFAHEFRPLWKKFMRGHGFANTTQIGSRADAPS